MVKENIDTFRRRLEGKMSKREVELVMFAYALAKESHRVQQRDGGERYFEHPRKGCLVLMDELKIFNPVLLVAFLLHDTGEDTLIWGNLSKDYDEWLKTATFRLNLICKQATPIVIGLTKPAIDNKKFHSREEVYYFYWNTMKHHSEIVLLKMIDRLINLREMSDCSVEKIEKQKQETRAVYLPMFQMLEKGLYKKHYHYLSSQIDVILAIL